MRTLPQEKAAQWEHSGPLQYNVGNWFPLANNNSFSLDIKNYSSSAKNALEGAHEYASICPSHHVYFLHIAANGPAAAPPADTPTDGVSDTCEQKFRSGNVRQIWMMEPGQQESTWHRVSTRLDQHSIPGY